MEINENYIKEEKKDTFKFEIKDFENKFVKCEFCKKLGTNFILERWDLSELYPIGYPKHVCKKCYNKIAKAFDANKKTK